MATSVKKLTNCNVYVNGTSLLGRVEEFDVPEVVYKMAEHKALGLAGSFEIPSGIDKMEARLKWSSFYPDVLGSASKPTAAVQIMVRGTVTDWGSAGLNNEQPVTIVMTALPKNLPGMKFKQHDNVEQETKFSVLRVKCVVAGQTTYEVDVMANIFTIDGVDILANFRNNL